MARTVSLKTRVLKEADREWAAAVVAEHFGSPSVVSRGIPHDTGELAGRIAEQSGKPVGLLHYRIEDDECEIVALISTEPGKGIGTALLRSAWQTARRKGCERLWLVTTNDNRTAQGFYESFAGELVAVHEGAVARSRALKPEIPELGEDDVPIEDEFEYEWRVAPQRRRRTYNVYVIRLDEDAWGSARFRKANPERDPGKPCVYVGSTMRSPERRFEQHLSNYKANRFAHLHGIELMPELYRDYQGFATRAEAEQAEARLGALLRQRGYGVWWG